MWCMRMDVVCIVLNPRWAWGVGSKGGSCSSHCKDGSGEHPACFRYVVTPMESMVANVFIPSGVTAEGKTGEAQPWRHQTLGATFCGSMQKLISSKRACVVWEARHFFSVYDVMDEMILPKQPWCHVQVQVEPSPGKIVGIKPKVYLTCGLRLPAQSWCKLSGWIWLAGVQILFLMVFHIGKTLLEVELGPSFGPWIELGPSPHLAWNFDCVFLREVERFHHFNVITLKFFQNCLFLPLWNSYKSKECEIWWPVVSFHSLEDA